MEAGADPAARRRRSTMVSGVAADRSPDSPATITVATWLDGIAASGPGGPKGPSATAPPGPLIATRLRGRGGRSWAWAARGARPKPSCPRGRWFGAGAPILFDVKQERVDHRPSRVAASERCWRRCSPAGRIETGDKLWARVGRRADRGRLRRVPCPARWRALGRRWDGVAGLLPRGGKPTRSMGLGRGRRGMRPPTWRVGKQPASGTKLAYVAGVPRDTGDPVRRGRRRSAARVAGGVQSRARMLSG